MNVSIKGSHGVVIQSFPRQYGNQQSLLMCKRKLAELLLQRPARQKGSVAAA